MDVFYRVRTMTTVTEKIVMERMTNEECPMEKCDELYFENTKDQRAKWNSRLEYILSLVGFCVGFGNLWRFPYICNRNGGGNMTLILCTLCMLECNLANLQ